MPDSEFRNAKLWSRIQNLDFVNVPACWTSCDGGRCCSNNFPDFNFRLLPTEGTTILYLEQEYDFLKAEGKTFESKRDASPAQLLDLDYGGPRPLRIVQAHCGLMGRCAGVIAKPLLCKLYPFLPVMNADGEIEDLAPASIFDLTAEEFGVLLPCGVRESAKSILERWRKDGAVREVFQHPYILFHLMAASAFIENYRWSIRSNGHLSRFRGAEFWTNWELQYLGGRLLDVDSLKKSIADIYRVVVERHGLFLE